MYNHLDQLHRINTQIADTFIQHEGMRKAFNQYVEAQHDFLTKVAEINSSTASIVTKQITDLFTQK